MKKFLILLLGFVLLNFVSGFVCAAQDAFGAANKIESEHFTIEYKDGVDPSDLDNRLKVSAMDEQLTNLSVDHSSTQKELASKIEILFNRASDVLDMHVYSLKAHIKIFADHQALVNFFHTMYPQAGALPCMGLSFYLTDYDSIYISPASFRREVLGHEMGHAIMSHYFVVQPSIKIQEVLAGYVEYQLRKTKE